MRRHNLFDAKNLLAKQGIITRLATNSFNNTPMNAVNLTVHSDVAVVLPLTAGETLVYNAVDAEFDVRTTDFSNADLSNLTTGMLWRTNEEGVWGAGQLDVRLDAATDVSVDNTAAGALVAVNTPSGATVSLQNVQSATLTGVNLSGATTTNECVGWNGASALVVVAPSTALSTDVDQTGKKPGHAIRGTAVAGEYDVGLYPLNALADTTVSAPATNHVLRGNTGGATWIGGVPRFALNEYALPDIAKDSQIEGSVYLITGADQLRLRRNSAFYLAFSATFTISGTTLNLGMGTWIGDVNWGDSALTAVNLTGQPTHTYASPGTYEVKFQGTVTGFTYAGTLAADKQALVSVDEWYDGLLFSNGGAVFKGCVNLATLPTGADLAPDLTGVTSLAEWFSGCTALTTLDLSVWDVAAITTAASLFFGCTALANAGLNSAAWSQCATFDSAFRNCSLLTSGVGAWTLKGTTSIVCASMFRDCTAFAGTGLNTWTNTSSITSMEAMFSNAAAFPGTTIEGWNVSAVTTFADCFSSCTVFDADLSTWATTSATNMSYMFELCGAFTSVVGGLATFDLSGVTNTSYMFSGCTSLVAAVNLSAWDVALVQDASRMFLGCTLFNADVSAWDTASLVNAHSMFMNCAAFVGTGLDQWDIVDVTQFTDFLNGAALTTANYDLLLVAYAAQAPTNVLSFHAGVSTQYNRTAAHATLSAVPWTFTDGGPVPAYVATYTIGGTELKLATGTWIGDVDWGDSTTTAVNLTGQPTRTYAAPGTYAVRFTGTVTGYTYNGTAAADKQALVSINEWYAGMTFPNAVNVFASCTNLTTLPSSGAPNLTGVTTLAAWFNGCTNLVTLGSIGSWNTTNITNVSSMFRLCSNLVNLDVTAWNKTSFTNVSWFLRQCPKFNGNLTGLVSASVNTNTEYVCNSCNAYTGTGLDTWVTTNVTGFANAFQSCTVLNADLSSWRFPNCATFWQAFWGCPALNSSFAGWTFRSAGVNLGNMFANNTALIGTGMETWNVSSATTFSQTFTGCPNLATDFSVWNVTSACTNTNGMFSGCTSLPATLDLSGWNMSNVTLANSMFGSCVQLTTPNFTWNLGANTNLSGMFNGCTNFTGVGSGVTGWNVSGVTLFTDMFKGCPALNLDLSAWVTTAATNMSGMFSGCTNYPGTGVGSFDLNGVTTCANMFLNCTSLTATLNLSTWDVSTVLTFQSMFQGCTSLTTPNFSNWAPTSATTFLLMFFACTNLQNFSGAAWTLRTTGSTYTMARMLENCTNWNDDISAWNVSKASTLSDFLKNNTAYTTANYDVLLNAWDGLTLTANAAVHFGDANFTIATSQTARNTIAATPWTIIDGGGI